MQSINPWPEGKPESGMFAAKKSLDLLLPFVETAHWSVLTVEMGGNFPVYNHFEYSKPFLRNLFGL